MVHTGVAGAHAHMRNHYSVRVAHFVIRKTIHKTDYQIDEIYHGATSDEIEFVERNEWQTKIWYH